ncbi:MAG: nucleotidyltransferase domain-containing protein [Candidatus Methylomirabilota bacterium]
MTDSPSASLSTTVAALLAKAEGDPSVLAVILFGSAARGESGPMSDTDLCLVLEPAVSGSGGSSDVRLAYLAASPGDRVDVRVFQQLPLYVQQRVLQDGRVLFCRDEPRLYGLAYRTVQAFEDYRPRYRRYLDEVAHARP